MAVVFCDVIGGSSYGMKEFPSDEKRMSFPKFFCVLEKKRGVDRFEMWKGGNARLQ